MTHEQRQELIKDMVKKDDLRPNGDGKHCFYCHEQLGKPHKESCVILEKTVLVEYRITIPKRTVRSWTKEDIEFDLNDSSWCASNLIKDLEEISEKACLCPFTSAKVIKMNLNHD